MTGLQVLLVGVLVLSLAVFAGFLFHLVVIPEDDDLDDEYDYW